MRSLRETSTAHSTQVRFLATVYARVARKLRQGCEGTTAYIAWIWFLPTMCPRVDLERYVARETFAAHVTLEWTLARMYAKMLGK